MTDKTEELRCVIRDLCEQVRERDAEIVRLRDENAGLRTDLDEQCRLLGMGGEREAKLMARMIRMVELMRKLREPDWHIESIREFQRELTALEGAALSDDSVLREMIEAARQEEREAIIAEMPGGHSVDPQWVCDMIRARKR